MQKNHIVIFCSNERENGKPFHPIRKNKWNDFNTEIFFSFLLTYFFGLNAKNTFPFIQWDNNFFYFFVFFLTIQFRNFALTAIIYEMWTWLQALPSRTFFFFYLPISLIYWIYFSLSHHVLSSSSLEFLFFFRFAQLCFVDEKLLRACTLLIFLHWIKTTFSIM